MPHKNDENQELQSGDLVFILAIAGRIDAQSRILAERLDKDRSIYYAYAVLDSLSTSYSMFKYFFDMFLATRDVDLIHNIMLTPAGIIAISLESLFLVGFSVCATHFEKEKEDPLKQFIAAAWPYFRDVMKGLKNAYKGWRSAIVAISLIGGLDLKYLIAPIGLVLGIFAAVNRFWLRKMVEDRKIMMTNNAELLLEIKKLQSLTQEECELYLSQLKYQSFSTRSMAYAAVAAGGLIDGLYLYVGVLGLAALSSPWLSVMAVICSVYTVACIVTRLYEEYDFQLRLFITQTKCELLLIAKQLETSYERLLQLRNKVDKTIEDLIAIHALELETCQLINKFEDKRKLLAAQTTRTYFSAVLLGIKSGLYAYGALASTMFLVGSILILTGTAFPPAMLIGGVILGLVFMVAFSIFFLVSTYNHLNKKNNDGVRPYHELIYMRNDLQNEQAFYLDADTFDQSIKDGLSFDSSPQFFFQEWFEVFRSLFSGFGKGKNFVGFAGNPLQELDENGHYQDSPIMHVLSVFSALFFGTVLALRALARGLGRTPLGQVNLADNIAVPAPASEDVTAKVVLKTEVPGESPPVKSPRTDSHNNTSSSLSNFGLFETKSRKSEASPASLPPAVDELDLATQTPTQNSTILGLT
ncbi:hypothetical protein [uncultured Legionella sp.]|uniref:hypothetical protein n=1 Tax=uncultured Legionella sp. TaxID=210934 RepID=UPI0026085A72|nr:hypothetical protein [uncultured Legionella sp.]